MAMKVKIFSSKNMDDLETIIDQFCENHEVLDIKFNTISFPEQLNNRNYMPVKYVVFSRVMIIYQDCKN